jgi:L,D-peptidoglycan transpeptidase YkuD (ErfK/YbiS/YcfS/YnhG family)
MKASKHDNVRLKLRPGIRELRVRKAGCLPDSPTFLWIGSGWVRCAIGRSGFTRRKREGDGGTPIGRFRILDWRFQPIRPPYSRGALEGRLIRRDSGWCDDPSSGAYNRQVRRPFPHTHEELWRDDGKYGVIGILDCNLRPRRMGAGSAIFFHICDDDFGATAGCVAIPEREMRKLLPRLGRDVTIEIG